MNPHASKPFRRLAVLSAALLLVTGCGNVIGPGKPMQLYTLEPQVSPASAPAGVVVAAPLSVGVPEADASLDTNRIALKPTAQTLDYFANAAWPDHLPSVIQSRLVESFEKDGRVAFVARDTAGMNSDYSLKSEIRAFQARYDVPDAAPEITLRIDVALVQTATGKIVARKEMSQQRRADANTLPAIVSAFNAATTAILKDIVDWTVSAVPPALPQESENRRHR